MRMDWIKWPLNWHFAKTSPLRYCCYDRLTIPLSRHMCSHSVKNTSRSKMETDNVPIDKTEQVTCGMKHETAWNCCYFCFINSNNKYHFVALQCDVTEHYSTSVQALCEPIISSSLLDIAWNKNERTSEGILFQPWKDINTNFSSSSSPTLTYSPVWFVCPTKMIQHYDWSASDRLSVRFSVNCQLSYLS